MKKTSWAYAPHSPISLFVCTLAICALAACFLLPVQAHAAEQPQVPRAVLTTSDQVPADTTVSKDVSQGKVYTIKTAAQWHNIGLYKGGTFKLGKNIVLANEKQYLTINKNYTYKIDLNGYQVKTAYTGVPLRTVAPLYITKGTVTLTNSKTKGLLYSTETAAVVVEGSAKFYQKNATIVNNATEFRSDITSGVMTYGTSKYYLQGTSKIQSIGNGVALFGSSRMYATGNPWVRAGANEYKGQFTHYGSGISIASKTARISLQGGSYGTKASADISLWSPAVTMTYAQSANYPILDQMGYAMDSAIGKGYQVVDAKGAIVKPRGSNLSDYYDGVNAPSWTELIGKLGYKEEQRYTTTVKDSAGYYAVYVTLTPAEKKARAARAKLRAQSVPVYWIVNKKTGENLYTTAANEVRVLTKVKKTWTNKGIMWYGPKKGTAVYRLVNLKTGDHHFTMDKKEVRVLTKVKKTWRADFSGKPVFYSGGKVKIWRLYSASRWKAGKAGTHKFATSNAKPKGWKNEGIKLYAATL